MAPFETLKLERPADGVLLVTLDRPEVSNAINTRMGLDLCALFRRPEMTSGDVRCLVVTGAGRRAFCAGGDLKERDGMTDEQWNTQHAIFEQAFAGFLECPLPIIAAINGHAFAGGLELALSCDFAYAVPAARFALTEVTIGIMPGGGGTQLLPRAVGERRAKEIILAGRPFTAQDAHRWGIVNELCEPDELLQRALATAAAIGANAPLSVRQAKKAIHTGLQMDLRSGMVLELEAYARLVVSEDRREGIRAFNEKRKPRFTGR